MGQRINVKHGDALVITNHPTPYANHRVGTVSGYAAQYGQAESEAVARAIANGHKTVWANAEPIVIQAAEYGDLGKTERIEVEHGDTLVIDSPYADEAGEYLLQPPRPGHADGDSARLVKQTGEAR